MGAFTEDLKAEVSSTPYTTGTMELNGKTVKLAAKPLTALDMVAIKRAHPDFGSNPTLEGMVDLLIRKAQAGDEDGGAAFDKADKPFLMRLNMNVIGGIFGELFGQQMEATNDETTVDGKKNT